MSCSYLSQNLQKKVQDTLADANSVAEEACSTMRTVRSFANELQEALTYREKLQKTYGVMRKEAVAYAGYMWCSEVSVILKYMDLSLNGMIGQFDHISDIDAMVFFKRLCFEITALCSVPGCGNFILWRAPCGCW
jgi:ABC-type multidrug transport system fused ATPase/permease subunit